MPDSLWYPGARRWSGNPNVTGYPDDYAKRVGYTGTGKRGPKRGSVNHSAEGTSWDVIHDLLLSKSWHFTIGYDRVEQHHEIDINAWHCTDTDDDGGIKGNFELVGKEHLGVAGQTLTPYQVKASTDIDKWMAKQFGRSTFHRFDGNDPDSPGVWVMCEHNEIANTGTSCPSHRIPWPLVMGILQLDTTEVDYMKGFAWVTTDAKPYKTWIVGPTPQGLRRSWVKSLEEEQALRAAGLISNTPTKITDAQLACYAEG